MEPRLSPLLMNAMELLGFDMEPGAFSLLLNPMELLESIEVQHDGEIRSSPTNMSMLFGQPTQANHTVDAKVSTYAQDLYDRNVKTGNAKIKANVREQYARDMNAAYADAFDRKLDHNEGEAVHPRHCIDLDVDDLSLLDLFEHCFHMKINAQDSKAKVEHQDLKLEATEANYLAKQLIDYFKRLMQKKADSKSKKTDSNSKKAASKSKKTDGNSKKADRKSKKANSNVKIKDQEAKSKNSEPNAEKTGHLQNSPGSDCYTIGRGKGKPVEGVARPHQCADPKLQHYIDLFNQVSDELFDDGDKLKAMPLSADAKFKGAKAMQATVEDD